VIVYAWMQAVGLVNDHLTSCFRYEPIRAMGA
jgi:DNA-3-methyladenine glycosylase I